MHLSVWNLGLGWYELIVRKCVGKKVLSLIEGLLFGSVVVQSEFLHSGAKGGL